MEKSETLKVAPHAGHYKSRGIEPIQFIEENRLGFHEGSIVKYITRWRDKDGVKDLEKVIWYAQRLIEQEKQKQDPTTQIPGSIVVPDGSALSLKEQRFA